MKKKIWSLLLCMTLLLGCAAAFPVTVRAGEETAKAPLTTGPCGAGVSYSFDSLAGVLTISGSGAMTEYKTGASPFAGREEIVSFKGGMSGRPDPDVGENCRVAGLFGKCLRASQCYNTGNVSASYISGHTGNSRIAGISTQNRGMTNCYNTGNVTVSNKGKKADALVYAGGLSAVTIAQDEKVISCYSTGTVKGTTDARRGEFQGQLIGCWLGTKMKKTCLIYDNYYTKSGKAYGGGDTFTPKAKKVSSISAGSCPKLSSKYWTYSSKHKRMILKNNKEK